MACFVGSAFHVAACPDCGGYGYIASTATNHRTRCPYCKGRGSVECVPRYLSREEEKIFQSALRRSVEHTDMEASDDG